MRRDEKWAAISVEGEARLVGFLFEAERDQVCDGAFVAVMSPDETLAGKRLEGRESFPIPGHGADGAVELLARRGEVRGGQWKRRLDTRGVRVGAGRVTSRLRG